ncbi:PREDICTED: uncharacterized protein LOC109217738 [Nicotiana attenuata]|uniref:uncharacterized protein LOC109217738 n=1 Tax=Nicotiana attenuata TaxID=49451 RepID=UPI000904FA54|nr:PREDICTED: uncharacterized protein LOC109217738 [Nicotiana attenuata]
MEMKGSNFGTIVKLLHSMLDVDGYCEDTETFVQKCEKYELYAQLVHQPAELLHWVVSAWPFMKWGMEIVGPYYRAPEKVEAGPYQKIVECKVVDFIWYHIIYRFGILKEIVCDNEPQFVGSKVSKFFEGLKIKRITSSSYHSSANRQAESTNKIIIQNLKKKLEDAKEK